MTRGLLSCDEFRLVPKPELEIAIPAEFARVTSGVCDYNTCDFYHNGGSSMKSPYQSDL